MDKRELLFRKVRKEYEAYVAQLKRNSTDDIIEKVDEIATMKLLCEAVTQGNIITNYEIDHFLKLHNPLRTLYEWSDFELGIYEDVKRIATMIVDENITDEPLFRLDDYVDRLHYKLQCAFERDGSGSEAPAIGHYGFYKHTHFYNYPFTDYEAKVLLQFQNPIEVITDFLEQVQGDNWNDQFANAMRNLLKKDILELPYELDEDNIMQDSYNWHAVMKDVRRLLNHAKPEITEKWLDVIRETILQQLAAEEQSENPYQSFMDNLIAIKTKYGTEMAETIHNLKAEHMALREDDMLPAAEYLKRGGDIDQIEELLDNGELVKFKPTRLQEDGGINLC